MAEGFLARWSQRKQDARTGHLPGDAVTRTPPAPAPEEAPVPDGAELAPPQVARTEGAPAMPAAAPLSLEDAHRLTLQSDFTPFGARGVASAVRNAALKTLFADPHFNVKDGMDVYIDDYSVPDPLPVSRLRQMACAKGLGLLQEAAAATASSCTGPEHLPESPRPSLGTDHANLDLRLQQNHAPGSAEPGCSPE